LAGQLGAHALQSIIFNTLGNLIQSPIVTGGLNINIDSPAILYEKIQDGKLYLAFDTVPDALDAILSTAGFTFIDETAMDTQILTIAIRLILSSSNLVVQTQYGMVAKVIISVFSAAYTDKCNRGGAAYPTNEAACLGAHIDYSLVNTTVAASSAVFSRMAGDFRLMADMLAPEAAAPKVTMRRQCSAEVFRLRARMLDAFALVNTTASGIEFAQLYNSTFRETPQDPGVCGIYARNDAGLQVHLAPTAICTANGSTALPACTSQNGSTLVPATTPIAMANGMTTTEVNPTTGLPVFRFRGLPSAGGGGSRRLLAVVDEEAANTNINHQHRRLQVAESASSANGATIVVSMRSRFRARASCQWSTFAEESVVCASSTCASTPGWYCSGSVDCKCAPIGFYSPVNDATLRSCTNKPAGASYTTDTHATAACPYTCGAGTYKTGAAGEYGAGLADCVAVETGYYSPAGNNVQLPCSLPAGSVSTYIVQFTGPGGGTDSCPSEAIRQVAWL
jgi:hypothetical protein